ncbi:MAG: hypothetical protein ABI333_22940 [bacterium]
MLWFTQRVSTALGSRVHRIPGLVGACLFAVVGLGLGLGLGVGVVVIGVGAVAGPSFAGGSRVAEAWASPAAELGTAGCKPSCVGKSCGSDGCGGTCGVCAKSKLCLGDRCVSNTTPALCAAIAGGWSGVIKAPQTHYLSGHVYRKQNACRARFRITFQANTGPGWVVEDFSIHFTGLRVRLVGTRIVQASRSSQYNRDRFTGQLNTSGNRFTGTNRDTLNQTAPVVLTKP